MGRGGEQTFSYAPNEDAQTPVSGATTGSLRISKGTLGQDALMTLGIEIPHTGIMPSAVSGHSKVILQADKFFGYLRDLAHKANVGLDESTPSAFEADTADEGVGVSMHEYHFQSSSEGLSFQGKIQIRVHPQDSEKFRAALKEELHDLHNQLTPVGEASHVSLIEAVREGSVCAAAEGRLRN